MKPAYAFSIPSVVDDTPLDCRIYHLEKFSSCLQRSDEVSWIKGAIVAHPYAPLGGSQDDHVVLATTGTLLDQGYIVGTFNFRGANESAGRTTWTGKAELQDYVSVTGFLVYYLHHLQQLRRSKDSTNTNSITAAPLASESHTTGRIQLILGGYSYGSLILARFPPTSDIVTRFESAPVGTAAAEIILRARTLAKQTWQCIEEQQQGPTSPRGRTLKPEQSPGSPSNRVSPMTMGGEETDPSERRRSRDSRRSADIIHRSVEVPHRVKARIKHRHVSRENSSLDEGPAGEQTTKSTNNAPSANAAPKVSTAYLSISPVLLPFSATVLPPGAPTSGFSLTAGKSEAGPSKQYLHYPTLTIFGSRDAFTSSKRLRHWAEKQERESQAQFRWSEIDSAGHFWGEEDVLRVLQEKVGEWSAGLLDGERKSGSGAAG